MELAPKKKRLAQSSLSKENRLAKENMAVVRAESPKKLKRHGVGC